MKKINFIILFVFIILFSNDSFSQALNNIQIIDGKTEFADLPISHQKKLLKYNGKYALGTPKIYYLPTNDPIFEKLNPALPNLLYRYSLKESSANCFWFAIFSTGVLPLPERFISAEEYISLLENEFDVLPKDEAWKTGDVIRIIHERASGMEIHAAMYLGHLQGHRIMLTKNGSQNGPYVLMNLDDLMRMVYIKSRILAVYRKKLPKKLL